MRKRILTFTVAAMLTSAAAFAQKPIVAESQLQEFMSSHPFNTASVEAH